MNYDQFKQAFEPVFQPATACRLANSSTKSYEPHLLVLNILFGEIR